ncbi:FAD-binding protein [Brevibacterium marinum]|uniref:FAD-binding protein n=1 Tax=Brevibacterium marinum TaxID=418643 RepID=UPI003CC91358
MKFARGSDQSIAIQPSGHGATGRASGAILLRTARLNEVVIDPEQRTASIGSGVKTGELQETAALWCGFVGSRRSEIRTRSSAGTSASSSDPAAFTLRVRASNP